MTEYERVDCQVVRQRNLSGNSPIGTWDESIQIVAFAAESLAYLALWCPPSQRTNYAISRGGGFLMARLGLQPQEFRMTSSTGRTIWCPVSETFFSASFVNRSSAATLPIS